MQLLAGASNTASSVSHLHPSSPGGLVVPQMVASRSARMSKSSRQARPSTRVNIAAPDRSAVDAAAMLPSMRPDIKGRYGK
jgi:hypothetical protein